VAESLPFPLIDEEIYEPPQDTEEGEPASVNGSAVADVRRDSGASDGKGCRGSSPGAGYRSASRVPEYEVRSHDGALLLMTRDKLKSMLASHAQEGRAVSKEDIDGFFEQLRASHARTI
jgi:E3 ubiquitin-protein ligase UBR7